ncbi:hypothetical protein NDU88_004250 [Pleurodeles waltl]|uniref:Uncharacterized protein n=1 Tax=Pleurodeles waltl TaxID=8319 RepID=A0AAV7V2Y7_PLEWA|nr:hypothetical protein NDU88_004250 [Pleurodeles waltl]
MKSSTRVKRWARRAGLEPCNHLSSLVYTASCGPGADLVRQLLGNRSSWALQGQRAEAAITPPCQTGGNRTGCGAGVLRGKKTEAASNWHTRGYFMGTEGRRVLAAVPGAGRLGGAAACPGLWYQSPGYQLKHILYLVYALDAGVRHTVNQALAQAIRLIEHHLIGFAKQQGWVVPPGSHIVEDPSLSGSSQALKQGKNPNSADFKSLIRSLAREHDYNTSSSTLKSKPKKDLDSSSSEQSSDQGSTLRKRKKKTHHQEDSIPTPKVLTFEPEDIVHPHSTLWLPPAEVVDYVESHIRHGFEKEVRSRLRS